MDGHGVYTYGTADSKSERGTLGKRKYEGTFQNNLMHGKGTFDWGDGQKYVGEYIRGDKEGYGEFDWGDGQVYKGHWKNGKQHGKGVFIDKRNPEVGF